MNFSITMRSESEHAVEIDNEELGITALDAVREELRTPRLLAQLLNAQIPCLREDLSYIEIPEATARESGHFLNRAHIVISVQPGFLNGCTETKIETTRDPETDEITSVRIYRSTNVENVLFAWNNAGYPLKWGFLEQEEKEDSTEETA